MTIRLTRRSAVALAAGAPMTGMAFPLGGEIDQAMVGILMRLGWCSPDSVASSKPQWCIWLPDWENQSPYWRPGQVVKGKWIPLAEYLAELEREFQLA